MNVDTLLTIAALICFAVATAGIKLDRVHFGWLGALFLTITLLTGS